MNHIQTRNRIDWMGLIIIAAMVGFLFAAGAWAQDSSNEKILKVNIQAEDGVKIDASLPFSVLEQALDSLPPAVHEVMKEQQVIAKEMIAELKHMEGRDLVRIKGKNNVSVGVVRWESEEDDFIKVMIRPGEEEVDEINICLPKGLAALALKAIKEIPVDDEHAELGKAIHEIMQTVQTELESLHHEDE